MSLAKAVLVTGATGFVGSGVLTRLVESSDTKLLGLVRTRGAQLPINVLPVLMSDEGLMGNVPLQGVEVIVHCAARVHVMDDRASEPLSEFRKVNVDGTLNLARQAVAVGVKRFIFISSIKVNGEGTKLGVPYAADDDPKPMDPYGISKMEAEKGLQQLAKETGLEVVIIRPVLVYGPGVKANFQTMMKWLSKGVPLPLGAVHNKRSLVALDNLVDLIVTCLDHPAAANQTFMVSDGEDLSTAELLSRISGALGRPARLLPVPVWLLELGAAIVGRRDVARRLCGSLQVDISKTRELLGWAPPIPVDEALAKTVKAFQANKNG